MADSKSNLQKEIKSIEREIKVAVKGGKGLSGQLKDKLADRLDKIGEKVDDLKDKKKIDDATSKALKEALKKAKSQLDVDLGN